MMTLEQIRAALQDRRLFVVADACNLHYNTLKAIRDGEMTNPTLTTMMRIEEYLKGASNDRPN
jgi:hypothetical protein